MDEDDEDEDAQWLREMSSLPLSEQLVLACGRNSWPGLECAEILIRKGAPLSIPATVTDPRTDHRIHATPLGVLR